MRVMINSVIIFRVIFTIAYTVLDESRLTCNGATTRLCYQYYCTYQDGQDEIRLRAGAKVILPSELVESYF